MPEIRTLGQLKETNYRYRSVKQELRENLIQRLRDKETLFPGIIGYDHSVLPQITHAILSRHDMLFLGLRGQAKTRMVRMLPQLLDESIPVLAQIEIPDDPLCPLTAVGKRLVEDQGDEALIRWVNRADRYHEKLATPDVTIADLIGEVDIVKHAEGRYLSDEATMHFGLIPRTNRGIFAINELPDLSPRIQVGLFNVLEERDVQIRGYPIRLNLDLCMAFSANPEDYTNRGRIVTPLKDRIGSVVRTHYPHGVDAAMAITRANAWVDRDTAPGSDPGTESGADSALPKVEVPNYLHRIIEEAITLARQSPHVNQASGVSVRTSIACIENIVSSAERRGLITGESRVMPRICDLSHMLASCRGKIELMLAEDGQGSEDKLLVSLIGEAVKAVFDNLAEVNDYELLIDQFQEGLTLVIGDDVSAAEQLANMRHVDGLMNHAEKLTLQLGLDPNDEQVLAGIGEFLLEALFVNNRLSKYSSSSGTGYRR
jgi:magnesium chelatase subunit I